MKKINKIKKVSVIGENEKGRKTAVAVNKLN